jgi:hypothetical protein
VFEDKLESAQVIAQSYNFKVAKLLMEKRTEDVAERSQYDTFMTGHANDYDDLQRRMIQVIVQLKENGFKVWRYKIENIQLDSRIYDSLELIDIEE